MLRVGKIALVLGLVGAMAFADNAPSERALAQHCLLPEPSYMRPPLFKRIKGAKRTGLVPAYETETGVRYYSIAEYKRLGLTWKEFRQKSERLASTRFLKLKPTFVKDKKGEVVYAKIESDSHLTASTVLAPEFFLILKKTLGEKMVVLIPSRFRIYVFPRATADFQEWGKRILEEYEEATDPVTYEVLELSKEGLQCVGSFRTD